MRSIYVLIIGFLLAGCSVEKEQEQLSCNSPIILNSVKEKYKNEVVQYIFDRGSYKHRFKNTMAPKEYLQHLNTLIDIDLKEIRQTDDDGFKTTCAATMYSSAGDFRSYDIHIYYDYTETLDSEDSKPYIRTSNVRETNYLVVPVLVYYNEKRGVSDQWNPIIRK